MTSLIVHTFFTPCFEGPPATQTDLWDKRWHEKKVGWAKSRRVRKSRERIKEATGRPNHFMFYCCKPFPTLHNTKWPKYDQTLTKSPMDTSGIPFYIPLASGGISNARIYIYKGSASMTQGSIFMRWGILINNWRVCIENLLFFAGLNVLKNPFAKICQACFWLWNWGGLPANCSLLILDVPTLLFVHSSCSGNTILVAQKRAMKFQIFLVSSHFLKKRREVWNNLNFNQCEAGVDMGGHRLSLPDS